MFLYYSQTQAKDRDFKGPDVLVALGVDGSRERLGWVSWQEGGKYPDVIIELSSPSTARGDRGQKKRLYEQTLRIPYYFIYDPFDPGSLEGWRLDFTQGYQSLHSNDRGWLWCDVLGH